METTLSLLKIAWFSCIATCIKNQSIKILLFLLKPCGTFSIETIETVTSASILLDVILVPNKYEIIYIKQY